jgi:hypothetical protein
MFVSIQPLMVGAWLATLLIVAWLIRGIVKAVIDKTDPKDVAHVLRALSPMLTGLARTLTSTHKSSTEAHRAPDTGAISSEGDDRHEQA